MTVSRLTRAQWRSVAENSLIAGAGAFLGTWLVAEDPFTMAAAKGAAMLAVMAVGKVVQKALTPDV